MGYSCPPCPYLVYDFALSEFVFSMKCFPIDSSRKQNMCSLGLQTSPRRRQKAILFVFFFQFLRPRARRKGASKRSVGSARPGLRSFCPAAEGRQWTISFSSLGNLDPMTRVEGVHNNDNCSTGVSYSLCVCLVSITKSSLCSRGTLASISARLYYRLGSLAEAI